MKLLCSVEDILCVEHYAVLIFGGYKFFNDVLESIVKNAPLTICMGHHTTHYTEIFLSRSSSFIQMCKTHSSTPASSSAAICDGSTEINNITPPSALGMRSANRPGHGLKRPGIQRPPSRNQHTTCSTHRDPRCNRQDGPRITLPRFRGDGIRTHHPPTPRGALPI